MPRPPDSCGIRGTFLGDFPVMNAPHTILLVKLSAIGDVLHGVPVAVAIKALRSRS